MTDEQLAAMHRLLAEYHRNLAKEQRSTLCNSITPILRSGLRMRPHRYRTAILERLHEREHRSQNVLDFLGRSYQLTKPRVKYGRHTCHRQEQTAPRQGRSRKSHWRSTSGDRN
jgi:hypothetical protein